MKRLAILGAGDLGRLLAHHAAVGGEHEPVCFFDDVHRGETVAGLPVAGGLAAYDDVLAAWRQDRFDALAMGVGYNHLEARARIFEELTTAGVPFATLVHPSCYVDRGATVDAGAVVFPGSVLDVGARIGRNTLVNTGCVVAHDTSVGPHSFLGPAVKLAGFVGVGAFCFLGIGTVVIDNVTLASHCRTGGGAVVTESCEESGVLLVGVPARVVQSP